MSAIPSLLSHPTATGEVHYLAYPGRGSSGAPTILLLHATGFLPWLWHPVAEALSHDNPVVVPYLSAREDDDPEKGGTGWRRLASGIVELARDLAIDRPVLVGHSMGGVVAVLAHADQGLPVSGLVLIEPIFMPEVFYEANMTLEQHQLAAKAAKRRGHWPDHQAARAYFLARPLFARWDERILDLYLRFGLKPAPAGGVELTCSPRQEAALFMGCDDVNPWPLIPDITCPVRIIEGELTENKGFIDCAALARQFSRGDFEQVPGAGHLVPMEKPEATVALIRDFLD